MMRERCRRKHHGVYKSGFMKATNHARKANDAVDAEDMFTRNITCVCRRHVVGRSINMLRCYFD